MADTDRPLFTFGSPEPDASLEEGMKWPWGRSHPSLLNVEAVSKWLVRKGVLSLGDRAKPADEWTWPTIKEGRSAVDPAYWINLRQRCLTAGPSYSMGVRIIEAVEEADAALRRDGDLGEVFGALARAQDGVLAAWEAGYRDYPIPGLVDGFSGLMALLAGMLRDEVMGRILSGRVEAGDAVAAMAVLCDGWTPEVAENAERFSERLRALRVSEH